MGMLEATHFLSLFLKVGSVLHLLIFAGRELYTCAPLEMKLVPVSSSSPLQILPTVACLVSCVHILIKERGFSTYQDLMCLEGCLINDKLLYTQPLTVSEQSSNWCPPTLACYCSSCSILQYLDCFEQVLFTISPNLNEID